MKAPEQELQVFHDDRLEGLADLLWGLGPLPDPFARECVVTHHRVMEAWLRHHFVYDWSRRPGAERRVLTNVEFQPLHLFVNEWLHRMSAPAGPAREPRFHPYSTDSIQWRIYGMLQAGDLEDPVFDELQTYLGDRTDARRAFQLAGQLAKLLDTYTVYRPLMMQDWERGRTDPRIPAWQPELWRRLVAKDDRTYLRQFQAMDGGGLRECGIRDAYRRVCVFGVPTLPPVYLHFFGRLAEVCPVRLFVFDPCREYWLDDLTARDAERLRLRNLEGAAVSDESLYLDVGNPLLSSLGGVARELMGELVERFELVSPDSRPYEAEQESLLQRLQSDIHHRRNQNAGGTSGCASDDPSVRIHICHSPLREVEVLQDHIWRWFAEDEELQPRDIQVQVSELETYAPYIESVFGIVPRDSPHAIPYTISDATRLHATQVGRTFASLLELPDSRFKAEQVMDLLACDSVRATFEIQEADLPALREWIREAGISWGRDAEHRQQSVRAGFAEGSWQQGLDRLLLGYALGSIDEPDHPTLTDAGALDRLAPFDRAEGTDLELLGRLFQFWNRLRDWTARLAEPCGPEEWEDRLHGLIDAFLASEDSSYRDVMALREAARAFVRLTRNAEIRTPVPLAVVRAFMKNELEQAAPGESLIGNSVVFSTLRAGSTTPRRIMCLLGLNDGVFPRVDRRPRFDLLRRSRQSCDPSRAKEDRLAFLEALLGARDRLHLSYVGRSTEEDEVFPPSIVLAELKDYLAGADTSETPAGSEPPTKERLDVEILHHLHPFHPDYFRPGELFSYSVANQAAAVRFASGEPPGEDKAKPRSLAASVPERVTVETWLGFFANPARYYFRELLGARAEPTRQAVPEETELFTCEGLQKYLADQELVKAMLAGCPTEDRTRVLASLQQRGCAPLGAYGQRDFDQRWSEIESVLHSPLAASGLPSNATLAQLLGLVEEAPIDVRLERFSIEGQVYVARLDGDRIHVRYRHTRVKAKDEVRTWLSHLLLCATGLKALSVCAGSELKKTTVFSPIRPEAARETLSGYVELFRDGHATPLPFAPESSKAWLIADRENLDPAEAAGRAWATSGFSRGDGDDPYNRRAFGPEGPMQQARFGELAERVLGPMLDLPATEPPPEAGR